MIISEEEKRTIAYHEAGHALVADLLPGADPLHKVTIIPRGRALGLTQQLPTDDKYNYSREYLINRITILMGGRAAEELVLQQQTTGAGDDLEKATEMARKMVCEWGMSDKMGPLTFGKSEEHIFLGPGDVAAEGLQRGDRDRHRRGDQAHRDRMRVPGPPASSRTTSRSSTPWPALSSSASRWTARRSPASSAPGPSRKPPRRSDPRAESRGATPRGAVGPLAGAFGPMFDLLW